MQGCRCSSLLVLAPPCSSLFVLARPCSSLVVTTAATAAVGAGLSLLGDERLERIDPVYAMPVSVLKGLGEHSPALTTATQAPPASHQNQWCASFSLSTVIGTKFYSTIVTRGSCWGTPKKLVRIV